MEDTTNITLQSSYLGFYWSGRILSSIRAQYNLLIRIFGQTIAYIIGLIVYLLLLICLLLVFSYSYYGIRRRHVQLTTGNYKRYRRQKEFLVSVNLDKKMVKKKNPPLFVRPLFSLYRASHNIYANYFLRLQHAFEALDRKTPDGDLFKHIPSDVLWDNRVKPYEYLV